MITQLNEEEILRLGAGYYSHVKQLKDGRMAAIYTRTHNTVIIADLHRGGYEDQW